MAVASASDDVPSTPRPKASTERICNIRAVNLGRFPRWYLAVQLAGHDHLRKLGITLIPATAPDFFLEDTPTAVLVRQVFGAIAQFDKATVVAKLKAARDRK
jgi:DNA invertase Pin-like site-specific DNA recombinase